MNYSSYVQTPKAVFEPYFAKGTRALDPQFWDLPEIWPKGDDANIFVGDAIGEVGRALYGAEWTGHEVNAYSWLPALPEPGTKKKRQQEEPPKVGKYPSQPPPSARVQQALRRVKPLDVPVLTAPNAHYFAWKGHHMRLEWQGICDHHAQGFARLSRVVAWISDRARNGELVTTLRFRNTAQGFGELLRAPAGMWNVEPVLEARFRKGSFVLRGIGGRVEAADVFAFFTRESLSRCIAALPSANLVLTGEDLSRLSPYLRFAIAVALKHKVFSRETQMTAEALESTLKEEWQKAGHGVLGQTPAKAMTKVIRHHDPDAIERGGLGGKK